MAASKTPVMLQHAAAKRAYPDAIVLFRLGDFYEMFGDDALLCAKLLDLTLTSRNKGKPDEIPMAGVPHHAAHGYIGRLLKAGHKVAICEQMADPATVRGIVPREVVRVLTPGTVTHGEHLQRASNNWLAALELSEGEVGLALVDVSTGELVASSVPNVTALLAELGRSAPREILIAAGPGSDVAALRQALGEILPETAVRVLPEGAVPTPVSADQARDLPASAAAALAQVLQYARACNPGRELPLRPLRLWLTRETMKLDVTVQEHLELVRRAGGESDASLLSVLDLTCTAMGARLLRRRLLAPLLDVATIRRRLDQVELLSEHATLRTRLRERLAEVSDLERLSVRAAIGEANPRDLGALRDGLLAARAAVQLLLAGDVPQVNEVLHVSPETDTLDDLAQRLARALVDRPPAQPKEGAIFRTDFDAKLSEFDELRKHGTERIVELEQRLKEQTDIATLKIRYTRVFGWYLEVSKAQLSRVPQQWRRKQTVAGGERYTLPELDELAERIAGAEEQHRERELQLLKELVALVAAQGDRIAQLAELVAGLDCTAALAEVAHRHDYCRPLVDDGNELHIEDGRHPVVERVAAPTGFVANDTHLDLDAERLWIITGPNMAGKSTYLRQTALIALMAQMGSFVPARSARVGVVDGIFSRVGASDNLARGESTFMVEMRETAQILRQAGERSLVIFDEIGRGTSTFDGLAIAWAVAEYLDGVVRCRGLFATHYHELTALAEGNPQVANRSVSARELGHEVVFLHRLVEGAASRSYGVAVARLAGLPETVLARAAALLSALEGEGAEAKQPRGKHLGSSRQMDLFQAAPTLSAQQREVLDTLRAFDVERSTPLDALQLIAQLKKLL